MGVAALALGGCASITTGTTQSIAVDTGGHMGAQCELQNAKGTWRVDPTPGMATVKRDYGDLTINCSSPDGAHGVSSVASSTEDMVWANYFIGGIVGGVIDISSGGAYRYPSFVQVNLFQPLGAARPSLSDLVRCSLRGSVEMRERGKCLAEGGQTIERVQ
jgi:hypothetical protein